MGSFGIYAALKYRAQQRQERQTAKRPQTSVTFLEGWDNRDIAQYLEKNQITSSADFLDSVKKFDSSNYQDLSTKPQNQGLEGFLFPDTYFIPKNPPAGQNISNII